MKRKTYKKIFIIVFFLATCTLLPDMAQASLESSLVGLKSRLTGIILPLLAVIGIAIAAISFFTGNNNAKQHLSYAVIGCVFGFGSQAIVDFISQTVR